jgi:hypothetical protein
VNWELINVNKVQCFRFIWKEYRALYSTRNGQDHLLRVIAPVFLEQTHSATIVDVDSMNERTGDGLTASRGKRLGIRIADCLPVYAFARDRIAVIHCGWRGIIQGIAHELKKHLNDFHYCLGAAIGPCCYEVKEDVADRFKHDHALAILRRDGRYFLDLKAAVVQDLGEDNLLGSLDLCTKCHPEFFYSNRRGDTARNYALAGDDTIDPEFVLR